MSSFICACGIKTFIYDWPPAEIEAGNKKMFERHIFCSCQREVVIRTAPKEEPDFQGEDDGEPKIVSQEHLAHMLGLPPAPEFVRQIVDNTPTTTENLASIDLSVDEAKVLKELTAHYGNVFKAAPPTTHEGPEKKDEQPQPDMFSEERAAYNTLAERVADGKFTINNIDEARMVRCAFSPRNTRRLYPVKDMDYDDEPNVINAKLAEMLKNRMLAILEAVNA
jgi:hypothetical protein